MLKEAPRLTRSRSRHARGSRLIIPPLPPTQVNDSPPFALTPNTIVGPEEPFTQEITVNDFIFVVTYQPGIDASWHRHAWNLLLFCIHLAPPSTHTRALPCPLYCPVDPCSQAGVCPGAADCRFLYDENHECVFLRAVGGRARQPSFPHPTRSPSPSVRQDASVTRTISGPTVGRALFSSRSSLPSGPPTPRFRPAACSTGTRPTMLS